MTKKAFGGIRDKVLKLKLRGEIFNFENGKKTLIAVVYGANVRDMRDRKRKIISALNEGEFN